MVDLGPRGSRRGLSWCGGCAPPRPARASSRARRLASRDRVAEALAAGAAGYVLREEGPDGLLGAVRAALDRRVSCCPPVVATAFGGRGGAHRRSREELETELDELRANVSQGTSAKADFLANISHELRTPVTVAKGIAYVLRNPAVPPEEREQFLGQLQSSLDKLMGIVDEIITIAELERGTFALEVAPMDLGPVDPPRGRRGQPRVPADADRRRRCPTSCRAIADGPADRRGRPRAAGQRLPLLPRRTRGRADRPHARRRRRRHRHRPRRGPRPLASR